MNSKKSDIRNSLKDELGRLFWTSFGVFLFILFFQPFPLIKLDENDRLLFVTGFGAISFFLACFVLIIIPLIWPKWFKITEWETGPPAILSLLLLVLTSTAFAFYIRFVGYDSISFYIMFKIALVCLIPIIILIILYKNKSLERIIEKIQEQNREYVFKLRNYEKSALEEDVEILSENKSDKLNLKYKNIVCIKSADNYIELSYLENNQIEKKLIRNTLRNIEQQLSGIGNFIRCHRTCIINTEFIEKLIRNYSGYYLKMSCFDEKIPVSRQYLVQIKATLEVME